MRYWYEIVQEIDCPDQLEYMVVREGTIEAPSQAEADRLVSAMCKKGQQFDLHPLAVSPAQ